MVADSARIRLKIGLIEIEYEGHSKFLSEELTDLVRTVVEIYNSNKDQLQESAAAPPNGQPNKKYSNGTLSTNTIASHLGVKSGSDLAIAAAAYLHLCGGKKTFSRQEIHDEMKAAPTYFKAAMSGNLSKMLNTLVKSQRLNLVKQGTYALSANETANMENHIAQLG